jgi:hypothetical protein
MKPEKLSDLKKVLLVLNVPELTEICLRLAKYKKENKELLAYLLFDANEPMKYAEDVKSFLIADFNTLQKHYFYSTKSLRKIIRLINRYSKYTGSKQVETELTIWFCRNYMTYVDLSTSHKPLQGLLIRQFEKITKLLPKLHEDLQFDYQKEYETLIIIAAQQIRWVNKSDFL